jgi:hypothetical protein
MKFVVNVAKFRYRHLLLSALTGKLFQIYEENLLNRTMNHHHGKLLESV